MTFYRNTNNQALAFKIDGQFYVVPPRGLIEIDDKFDYVVRGRGYPLTPAEQTSGALAEDETTLYRLAIEFERDPDDLLRDNARAFPELASSRGIDPPSPEPAPRVARKRARA